MLTRSSARPFRSSRTSWIGRGSGSPSTSTLGSSIRRAGHHMLQRQQVSALQARAPKLSTSPGDRARPSRPLQVAVASNSSRTITFMQRLNATLIRNGLALLQGEPRHRERLPSGGAVLRDRLAITVTCREQEASVAWCLCAICAAWLLCMCNARNRDELEIVSRVGDVPGGRIDARSVRTTQESSSSAKYRVQ